MDREETPVAGREAAVLCLRMLFDSLITGLMVAAKTLLVPYARAAVHKHGSYYQAQFQPLQHRRGSKTAICAMAASTLTTIFHKPRDGTVYKYLGADHLQRSSEVIPPSPPKVRRLLLPLLVIFALSNPARSDGKEPAEPEIWLAPLPANDRLTRRGAPDFFGLFEPSAPWGAVSTHVVVFKIYLDLLQRSSDEQLRQLIDDLRRRNIALALETPVLVDTGWCAPGVAKTMWMLPPFARLKRLGADLRYLAMVGPLVDGHVYLKEHYCHRPIQEVAQDAARTVAAIRVLYPHIVVGEIEPVGRRSDYPDWAEFAEWMAAIRIATGRPLAFIHMDVTWGLDWQDDLQDVARQARRAGVAFGVIYDGDGSETSSEAVATHVTRHAQQVEALSGMPPDQVIFQSWSNYPDHVLPESDPTSMTGMVLDYLRPHTEIHMIGSDRVRLTTSDGTPVANVDVLVERSRSSNKSSLVPQRLSGVVPSGAVSAIFALRVHMECDCLPHAAEIALSAFSYTEAKAHPSPPLRWGPRARSYNAQKDGKVGNSAGPSVVTVRAQPTQPVLLNSPEFPVTADAPFDARFAWSVDPQSAGTGYVAVIFKGRDGKEIHRAPLDFVTSHDMGTTFRTDAQGMLQLRPQTRDGFVLIQFRGDAGHGPAELSVAPFAGELGH